MSVKKLKAQSSLLLILIFNLFAFNSLRAIEPSTMWFNGAGGTYDDLSQSIVCDKNGNSYVVGYFRSSEFTIGSITLKHTYSGDAHFFIAKYDKDGNVLWAKTTAKDEFVYGLCAALDTEDNIIVGGHFSGYTATFGTTVLINSNAYTYGKMYLAKYDKDGNVLWAKTPSASSYSCSVIGVATDKTDNIYLTGHFQDGLFTFANKSIANATPGYQDVFLYKLTSSGTGVWAKMMGGTNHDLGNALAVDKNDNIFIAGSFKSSVMNAGSILLSNSSSNGTQDMFVAKFDGTGLLKWTKKAGGVDAEDGTSIAVDTLGNAYVGGYYKSTNAVFGLQSVSKVTTSNSCLYLSKYDTNGDVVWVKTTSDNANNSSINGVFVDKSSNIYTTGYYQSSSLNLDNLTLTNSAQNAQEMFVARYDSLGIAKWAKSIIGFGNDYGKSVTGDNIGNLYFTGMFAGNYLSSDGFFNINNSNGTNDISTFRIYDPLSKEVYTNDQNLMHNSKIKYYPNPFRNFVNIEISQSLTDIELQVFNNLGQKVNVNYSKKDNQLEINTTQLVKGMYYFRIVENDKVIDSKLLIAE
jgi:hypothetical protein